MFIRERTAQAVFTTWPSGRSTHSRTTQDYSLNQKLFFRVQQIRIIQEPNRSSTGVGKKVYLEVLAPAAVLMLLAKYIGKSLLEGAIDLRAVSDAKALALCEGTECEPPSIRVANTPAAVPATENENEGYVENMGTCKEVIKVRENTQ